MNRYLTWLSAFCWVLTFAVFDGVVRPLPAGAQCFTYIQALDAPDIEYFGTQPPDHRVWVGQRFNINCDGQFLTARFRIYLSAINFNGVRSLTNGDTIICSLLDDQFLEIARVEQVLTFGLGYRWLEFDFSAYDLGLATGDLTAKISTPHEAFGFLATGGDRVNGELMVGYDSGIWARGLREATFKVTWNPWAQIVANEGLTWGAVKAQYR